MSVELQRALHTLMKRHEHEIHEFRITVHPELLNRLLHSVACNPNLPAIDQQQKHPQHHQSFTACVTHVLNPSVTYVLTYAPSALSVQSNRLPVLH